MLQLRYTELGAEKTHTLKPGVTLIGRLPTSDLVLADTTVSRLHARLRMTGAECRLEDANSRFGTFLDGELVRSEVVVPPGATIKLGETTLTLEQYVPEQELLSENHQVSEGPGTIIRAMPPASPRGGDGHLVRLLADAQRALLSTQSLNDVLAKVVDLAFTAVPAERAFLLLRESADEALVARVLRHRDGTIPANPTLSRMVVRRVMRERLAVLAADATCDPRLGVTDSILRFNIRSFMCAPLWDREEVIGVLYVDSPRSAQFVEADLDAFTALANGAAVAIEQARLAGQLLEETRRRERLSRYHSPAVVSRIIHAPEGSVGLEAQERDVSVMFCDIVGFTTLSERRDPEQVDRGLCGGERGDHLVARASRAPRHHDLLELDRHHVVEPHRRRRHFVQDRVEDRARRIAAKRQQARGHLVWARLAVAVSLPRRVRPALEDVADIDLLPLHLDRG